jgi:hypothetical protein
MKAIRALVLALSLGLLLALPSVATAANRYVYYGACGTTSAAQSSHTCSKSSNKAAFFKSRDASVTYKVCVKYPNGTKLCANGQPAPKGKLKSVTITSTLKGAHNITWFVGSTKVGAWKLTVV